MTGDSYGQLPQDYMKDPQVVAEAVLHEFEATCD